MEIYIAVLLCCADHIIDIEYQHLSRIYSVIAQTRNFQEWDIGKEKYKIIIMMTTIIITKK